MRIRKLNLTNLCLFLLVVLPIYQDSPFSRVLGAAGYYLLMPLSLICYTVYVLVKGRTPKNEFLRNITRLGIWMALVSFVAIVVWGVLGNSMVVVGEYLPYKAIKVLLQYFSYPAYIALLIVFLRKKGSIALQNYVFITLILLTVICLLERQQLPYAFESIHFAGHFPYSRVRLLTMESSTTAMLIFVYTGISLYYSLIIKQRVIGIISVICSVILFWSTGSKALMSSIGIFMIVYVIFSFRKLNVRSITGLLLAAVVLLVFVEAILPSLASHFRRDINDYTSIATRIYTSVIGLGIGCVFPLGIGGGVYLGVYQNALLKYLSNFTNLFPFFNTTEIIKLATMNTDKALTVKSGIFHFNMYWGICGTYFLFMNFKKISKQIIESNIKNSNILLALLWTAIILMTVALNFTFEFWLLYAYMICLNEEAKEKTYEFM